MSEKVKKGNWTIVAQDGNLNQDGLGDTNGGKITVEPYSALILYRTK